MAEHAHVALTLFVTLYNSCDVVTEGHLIEDNDDTKIVEEHNEDYDKDDEKNETASGHRCQHR